MISKKRDKNGEEILCPRSYNIKIPTKVKEKINFIRIKIIIIYITQCKITFKQKEKEAKFILHNVRLQSPVGITLPKASL